MAANGNTLSLGVCILAFEITPVILNKKIAAKGNTIVHKINDPSQFLFGHTSGFMRYRITAVIAVINKGWKTSDAISEKTMIGFERVRGKGLSLGFWFIIRVIPNYVPFKADIKPILNKT